MTAEKALTDSSKGQETAAKSTAVQEAPAAAPAAVSAQPLAQQPQAPADKAAIAAARKILDEVAATYKSLETYQDEGTISTDIDAGPTKVKSGTKFSITLKKPNLYRISWSQKNASIPGLTQSGTVWSDGTQPYLYMGALHAYSKMGSDEDRLGRGDGHLGWGRLHDSVALFAGLQATGSVLPTERPQDRNDGESRRQRLLRHQQHLDDIGEGDVLDLKVETPHPKVFPLVQSSGRRPENAHTDRRPTGGIPPGHGHEGHRRKREEHEREDGPGKGAVKDMKLSGTSTELHQKISTPALKPDDFQFTPPKDAVLKDSLFGGMLEQKLPPLPPQKAIPEQPIVPAIKPLPAPEPQPLPLRGTVIDVRGMPLAGARCCRYAENRQST